MKGRYVVLTREDFEAAALEKTRRIDILDFVDGKQIDDRYFDKPYYLTPAAGGDRAYALLVTPLHEPAYDRGTGNRQDGPPLARVLL